MAKASRKNPPKPAAEPVAAVIPAGSPAGEVQQPSTLLTEAAAGSLAGEGPEGITGDAEVPAPNTGAVASAPATFSADNTPEADQGDRAGASGAGPVPPPEAVSFFAGCPRLRAAMAAATAEHGQVELRLRVTAKREGFRRAGIAHFGTVDHEYWQFRPDQIEAMLAEPHLDASFVPARFDP